MKAFLTFQVASTLICFHYITLSDTLQFLGNGPPSTNDEETVANIPAVSRLLQGLGGLKPKIPASSAATTSAKIENDKNDFRVNKLSHKGLHRYRKKAVHDMLHRLLNAYAEQQIMQDSKTAYKLKSRDSSKKSGSFKISDGPVSGAGVYSISRDQSDIEIDLKLKVNDQQQQQRNQHPSLLPSREQQHRQKTAKLQPQKQQQQQQRKPQPPPTPQQLQKPQLQHQKQQPQQKPPQQQQRQISTTPVPPQTVTTKPKMCLAPCSTTQAPQNTNCMAIASQFEKEALNIHNRYRSIHKAPPMTLNCEMSWNAAAYAQKLADMDSLVQSSYTERPEQGENLSIGCYGDRELTAEEAIKMWFDEVCHYTFGKDGPQPGTNHFTQLVWKGSTELGIGKASNKQSSGDICTFIVARYKPQGNIENDDNAYIKNIEKGSFDVRYCSNIKKAGLDGGYGFKRFQST